MDSANDGGQLESKWSSGYHRHNTTTTAKPAMLFP